MKKKLSTALLVFVIWHLVRPLILLMVAGIYLFVIPAAYAAGPPNPQPCKNPITDENQLVNNYLVDKTGKPPIAPLTYNVTPNADNEVTLESKTFTFKVDFSKLQALFGGSNSNYLEGDFQNPEHLQTNVTALDSQNFNEYYKSLQKTTPKSVIDTQKVDYVKYINDHPGLPEASNKYNDIEGAGNLKTIYDLVNEYGIPSPPKPSQNTNTWNNTWGKYWPKIPTAWSQFYAGKIWFHQVIGDKSLEDLKTSEICPIQIPDAEVNFVIPDFYRTTAVSDQLNRSIVAKAAQSFQEHGILNPESPITSNPKNNPLQSFFSYCWKLLTAPTDVVKDIQKAVSANFPNLPDFPNLPNFFTSPAFAAEADNPSCIKPLAEAKAGHAPYCPLPLSEVSRLGSRVSCQNKDDSLKLEKDNPNVVCTFTFQTRSTTVDFDPANCTNSDLSQGCNLNLYVIPNFRLPWIAAIWNNTLFSEKGQTANNPESLSNRPGVYSFFTPQSVGEEPITKAELNTLFTECIQSKDLASEACQKLIDIYEELNKNDPTPDTGCLDIALDSEEPSKLVKCFETVIGQLDKALPGQAQNPSAEDPKERFVGAVQCANHFVSQVSLKPIALQEKQGIKQECDLSDNTPGSGSGNPGGPVVIPNCTDPSVTNPSDGNNSNGIETSKDQLICYIVQVASGKTEKLSGDPLPDVMIRVMNLESGGQQCAVSTYAALGVFQFVAGTWNEQPQASKPLDSGNGQGMAIGEINPGKTCWGITGPEPTATASGSNEYSWPIQSGGQNLDSGAWNPFWQIEAATRIMESAGGCIWTPYQSLYPDNCDGFSPAARFRI